MSKSWLVKDFQNKFFLYCNESKFLISRYIPKVNNNRIKQIKIEEYANKSKD